MTIVKFTTVALLAGVFLLLRNGCASAEDAETGPGSSPYEGQQSALGAKLGEIDVLLAGIEENLARAAELQSRLDELNTGLADSADETAHDSKELGRQLEEALRLFNERIAPLIATRVATSASNELEQKISSLQGLGSTPPDGGSTSLTNSFEEIAASLSAAQRAAGLAREAAKEMISSHDLTTTTD